MNRINVLLAAAVIPAGIIAFTAPGSLHADDSTAPIFVTKIPPGYREGKIPYPDGTIIAALHYGYVPSAENNKVFGQAQSFVPGPVPNIQFMVKDSTKYAATGGWGFANQAKASDLVFTHYAP